MGHLQTVEQDFRRLLAEGDEEALVQFVKEQVLASYRNGQAAQERAPAAGRDEPAAPPRRAWKKRSA